MAPPIATSKARMKIGGAAGEFAQRAFDPKFVVPAVMGETLDDFVLPRRAVLRGQLDDLAHLKPMLCFRARESYRQAVTASFTASSSRPSESVGLL
jgi:hypothetical protein